MEKIVALASTMIFVRAEEAVTEEPSVHVLGK